MQPQTPKKTKKPNSQAPTLRGRALRLLSQREFTRQELEKRLRAHAEEPADLEALLDDLAQRGWLSDARYAEALVRKRTGQFSRRAIAQELKRAGIAAEVTDAALAQADPDEEFAEAIVLCRRKFRSAPVDQKDTARQVRFLQSRGFGLSLALRVVKQRSLAEQDAVEC